MDSGSAAPFLWCPPSLGALSMCLFCLLIQPGMSCRNAALCRHTSPIIWIVESSVVAVVTCTNLEAMSCVLVLQPTMVLRISRICQTKLSFVRPFERKNRFGMFTMTSIYWMIAVYWAKWYISNS